MFDYSFARARGEPGAPVRARDEKQGVLALFSVLMLPSITPTTFSRRERARQRQRVRSFQWPSR